MSELRVWDAILAWKEDVLQKDLLRKTKIGYLSDMSTLIEKKVLNPKQPLSEFREICISEQMKLVSEIVEWSFATRDTKGRLLRSFCEFARKKIKKTDIEIPSNEDPSLNSLAMSELLSINEDKAESQHLTLKEINNFLINLRDVNFRDYLICRLMWELKCTANQILNMSMKDINSSTGVWIFTISKTEFRRGNLRDDLKNLVLKQMEGKTGLLFLTDQGKRIHQGQLVRTMKIASKLAKLPITMSPKIICAHAKGHYERAFLAIPEDERNKLFEELAILEHGLLLKKRKGPKLKNS